MKFESQNMRRKFKLLIFKYIAVIKSPVLIFK